MIKFLLKNQIKNRYLILSALAVLFFSMQSSFAQTLVTSVEAENGTRAGGLTIATANTGYSGSGYVTNMANTGDNLTIPVTVPSAGNYKLVIRYNGLYGTKDQDIYVNGVFVSSLNFPATTGYADLTAGSLTLNAGSNTIGIYKNWGYTDFDKVSLYTVPLHDYTTVAAAPIDPAATPEALALYNYFKSNYGQTIISGQTSDKYATVSPNAAKKPVLRAYDFQHYTVGYSYLWNNTTNSQGFGWEDDGTTQAAIDWYNSTCQKGIVAFHWHWHSPSGGQAGTNTFYTNSTTFDVTKAVTVGTAEYTAVIRDIDSIATQLKKLQSAGVPVMWRPLHEAGGAWFWWGAKGSAPALALYDIMYNRLVNYHGIHNLIWQWSTPEPSWYPGNSKVDMLGYDSYPGAYNYGTQKLIFDQLFTIVNGQKMVAMTENGPIPDPDACFTSDAKWAYFMSWSDLVTQQNSAAQLSLVFNHAKVTTLDEVTTATNTAKLTAAGPTSFCTGGSVLLKANVAKGYTYKWYNSGNLISGATASTYTATTAGSYTVAVTATGSCTTTSSAIVVTIGGPVATITPATATTFCQGGSVVLNASTGTGYTYQWNVGGNPIASATNASYTANSTGGYTVKVTSSTCNTTSTATQVTVNSLPTAIITAGSSTSFCQGGSVVLTSSTGSSYKWMNGSSAISNATNATYTATSTGSYTVEVTNASNCKATSAATTVTVNAAPAAPTVVSTVAYCQNSTAAQLTATGTALKWYADNTTTTALANAPTPSTTATGTINYYVSQTANGCESSHAQIAVTVNALPAATITAGGSTTFCQGGSVALTSSTGSSYKWMNGGNAISGATSASYTAITAGSYTVEVTNANNCKATSAATTVTVNSLPIVTMTSGGPTTFCQGGSVVLTSSTGSSYKWMNGSSAISNATNATYTVTSTGSYTVEVTNANNCKATSTATAVTVNAPTATPTVTSTVAYCQNAVAAQLTATGTALKWYADNTTTTALANAPTPVTTATGTINYYVSQTANGCESSRAQIAVTVNALPIATITAGGSTTFCQGGSVVLTSSTGSSYKWMNGGSAITNATNATYTATSSGSYTVEVTNANNCKKTSVATTVTVSAPPTASISISASTTICQAYVLTASAGTSYQWFTGGAPINGATNSTYTGTGGLSYSVEIKNAAGCKATATVTLPVTSMIAISITPAGPVALCSGQSVILNAPANTGYTYQWNVGGSQIIGATNASYTVTQAGLYSVTVVASGCSVTSSDVEVTVNSLLAQITSVGPTTFCQGDNVTLMANQSVAYKWMNGGNVINGATERNYTASSAGSYTVELTGMGGCKATSQAVVVNVSGTLTWYLDADGDGKGDASVTKQECIQPTGYVSIAGDACPNDANKIAAGNCGCGATENSCLDCMGVPNGTAAFDVCNVCAGGTSGITPKTNISQCTATSTTSALADNVKMYPNPTADNCKIELSGSEFKVSIYTSSGILLSSSAFQNEAIIGNGLAQGIYLIRIEQDGKTELRKLIKQ